ncbi:5-oxoprolinase subunit PxpA [Microbacterium betulae]|uniref:5-oxoprolinase subunit PxpA n=1 Tax=Microbacterium betulae TaxID=2981139 RepID=A0AA97FH68_9MICO|nr:5-oxoprolinase subunit PxpA [Microbacterium sp. AB]WOF22930.1 5-oxoprolinase subunit PxpA [Microbacterium sp. AB]
MARTGRILINSDMGEAFGLHTFGNDPDLLRIVDLANVACGFHAGDPGIMRETVALATESGVRVGAHPGLPDLVGFGRRRMALRPDEAADLVVYQTGALVGFLDAVGEPLSHIKPHGALWGMLAADADLMRAVARAVKAFDVPFLGLADTAHESVCAEAGVPFVGELYVDMDYNADGTLALARSARRTDPAAAAERVAKALAGEPVASVDGTPVDVRFQSVCVHSDSPDAPDVARAVRAVVDARTPRED